MRRVTQEIDSRARRFDDQHYLQRCTPRRPRGRWSKINREKAEAKAPADLQRQLDADPGAAEFFASLDSADRYARSVNPVVPGMRGQPAP